MRPKPGNRELRLLVDGLHEVKTSAAQIIQRGMADMLSDGLSHPLPKPFNGIEVRTVSWQRKNVEAQGLREGAHLVATMIGSAIPNEHNGVRCAV